MVVLEVVKFLHVIVFWYTIEEILFVGVFIWMLFALVVDSLLVRCIISV